MKRSDFLKRIGLVVGAIAALPFLPKAVSPEVKRYCGVDFATGDGYSVAYMLWPGDPPIIKFINARDFYKNPTLLSPGTPEYNYERNPFKINTIVSTPRKDSSVP